MLSQQKHDSSKDAGLVDERTCPGDIVMEKGFEDSAGSEVKFTERAGTTNSGASEQGSDQGDGKDGLSKLERSQTRTLGKLKFRPQNDHDPIDWWFASTAIPLMAATFAPMANLLSIAALVVFWRNNVQYPDDPALKYSVPSGSLSSDPKWCYNLNVVSLVCGFMGNLFLLFNFTQRVRYIVALPITIFFFSLASGILIGIIVCMDRYAPPSETQVYSQGYWHAVIAACLYFLNSMILMVNMAGYFLGHYPQHFTLTDEQRNLILQTMLFFIWLGGGAGIFSWQEGWSYPDALYFCDVTILTIGFGDYFATNDVGRGLVFPFSVGGTIILGLMVNSIHKFARELSKEKVVRKHVESRRVNTLSRAITLDELDDTNLGLLAEGKMPNISSPLQSDRDHIQQRLDELARQEQEKRRVVNFELPKRDKYGSSPLSSDTNHPSSTSPDFRMSHYKRSSGHGLSHAVTFPIPKPVPFNSLRRITSRSTKKILMIEERDRFNAMRRVQKNASIFNRYYALTMSIISFGMLWCLGAMAFYYAERETQNFTYFRGLYFCYVSLLTIGYGDLSPKSNAGKAFFVVWSLIAVPTMTILVSDLGETVIGGFKRGVLQNDLGLTSSGSPAGRSTKFFQRLFNATKQIKIVRRQPESKAVCHVEIGPETDTTVDERIHNDRTMTIDDLVEDDLSQPEMFRKLAFAIRRTAEDLRNEPGKVYKYEDWVEFTRLIRFSRSCASGDDAQAKLEYDEATEGVVDWDWLDDKSPMTSEQTESEWILDRLCESLLRIFNRGELLASILSGATSSKMPAYLGSVSSPQRDWSSGKLDVQHHASRLQTEGDNASDTRSVNAIERLLQGDAGKGSLKWSKRARARRTALHHDSARRRSSASIKHKRHGPFASRHKGSEDARTAPGNTNDSAVGTTGLGIDGVQGHN